METRYPAPDSHAAVAAGLFEDFGRGAYNVAPEHEINRRGEVIRQRAEGRTGGGMACPACGKIGLIMFNEERAKGAPTRMRCGNDPSCGVAVNMSIRGGQVVLEGGGVTMWNGQEMDVPF